MRCCSKEAWLRSASARMKRPGRPLTAERSVLKSPPTCGATKSRACSAPSGRRRWCLRRFLVPGVDFGEPVIGRFVGGAAQEGDDDEQVVGLGVGEGQP